MASSYAIYTEVCQASSSSTRTNMLYRRFAMSASNDGNDPKGKSAETAINIAPPRVLLVDDSPSDCVTTSINLGRHDVLVTAVEGPRQALEILNSEHVVNLVLTVDCMPHMNGYDLLMEMKKSPKLNHLPVVITSEDIIPDRVKKCMDGGAKDYIQKPINSSNIASILSYI
ncbi:hypothetical protein GQ55_6G162100 [Panicum hallii var. hallii]|uniref:Response regulatory domain-containing protein n=1 Tax=Panicum hallii var. hallii TaxID=1504633 RepID=A0A2T7D6L0_9POAL|nr:hypothetical protein GQ55_6G162100 [Panicum hallii var. hallii]